MKKNNTSKNNLQRPEEQHTVLSGIEVQEQHKKFGNDEKFLRFLLNSLEDYAIFTTDTTGHVISWSTGSKNLLGYTEDEIIGKDGDIFYTEKDINDGVPQKELHHALTKGRAVNERFHVRKNGSMFWGSGLAFPLYDEHKKHHGFTKVMRDLTDRKKAHQSLVDATEYFKNIVDTVREPLIVLNKDLTVNTANRAFYKVFKVKKKDVIGISIYAIDHSKWNTEQLRTVLQKTLIQKSALSDFEVGYESPLAGKRTMLLNARNLYGVGTRKEMVLMAIEDVTDKKELEQQRNDFIGIVSHELKTPVTSLKAFGQVLQLKLAKSKDDKSVEMLRKMDAQINKLTLLINDLLDATKIEGGKLQFNEEIFLIDDVIDEVIEEVQRTTSNHLITREGISNARMKGDRYQIGQVLTNLLTNAIKYSPGADKVIVTTVARDEKVICSVQDFGIGISENQQKNVFERFFRVSGDKLQTFPGVGLGLYISAEIIRRQCGQIWLESKPGRGTTFSFNLPSYKPKQ